MADLTAMLQAAAGNAGGDANFIEDVFSTFLYTGNGSTQTINNGIDLAGEGGLVWIKDRTVAQANNLVDTVRGAGNYLSSNTTDTNTFTLQNVGAFTGSGFTVGDGVNSQGLVNTSNDLYVSWTFRKQPKFFDVVTYTGTGANRTVAHGLGSVPGAIWVKRTDASADWQCYHRSLANTQYMVLNSTAAVATGATRWNSTTPTDAVFSLGTDTTVNASGGTYVAYVYAHDAGGFGLSGGDNVISCGSFTVSSSSGSTDVNLGYEPQWLLAKPSNNPGFATNWNLYDTMRGWVNTTDAGNVNRRLNPNLAQVETTDKLFQPNATGFTMLNSAVFPGVPITYIYIAIRRGPMKVPETGTSVFAPVARSGTGAAATITSTFAPDMVSGGVRNTSGGKIWTDKLRGVNSQLTSTSDAAQTTNNNDVTAYLNTGVTVGASSSALINASGPTYATYLWQRAPGFFDVVCYTGDGNYAPPPSDFKVAHNLTVRPEMVIIKRRNGASNWNPAVAISSTQWVNGPTTGFGLNRTDPADTPYNFSTLSYASSTTFSPAVVAGNTGGGFSGSTNDSGATYVAYLFASVAGVSKVGSYTGTGTTQVINCGFTAGSRFIMIKRTDSTGNWYVWDSARGIVAGDDPFFWLNSTAAEVTNTDFVDPAAVGFEISSTAPAEINASGGTFLFLAIA